MALLALFLLSIIFSAASAQYPVVCDFDFRPSCFSHGVRSLPMGVGCNVVTIRNFRKVPDAECEQLRRRLFQQ
ncbi:unnamed protein product [Hermetia illucens]|uniref:Uncharacterized protein n=1 Tax=Hermetia illucens TaxID=343691 RepID=A0A7R8UI55_HERIL|nr:unnamed protein product [Hermetia illucens]